ncbi:MAG: small, acid-soluble spore protein, H family [Acidobacteriota bacterium]
MEISRAKEVFDNMGVIEVTHNNMPIWIEDIHGSVAQIRYLIDDHTAQVPVSELNEQDTPPLDLMEEYLDGSLTQIGRDEDGWTE